MKLKQIRVIEYQCGEEEKIKQIIYKSKVPIVIKIKNFPDKFSLDYFAQDEDAMTCYSTFENYRCISTQSGNFSKVLSDIKNNKPYRIFGQFMSKSTCRELERYVPLWQKIPFRPRYFYDDIKVAYFFGGKGSATDMHFDREHCCNLHLCLSGKKQLLLFTESQSENVYKLPFISDSLINFSEPLDKIREQFPRINNAEVYNVILEQGDMLFMPKNCWHYTRYLDASSSATYVFYPKKFLQFYGYFTGYFYVGYKSEAGFKIANRPLFQKFSRRYALSSGIPKYFYKIIESILFIFMLPIISILYVISFKVKQFRGY